MLNQVVLIGKICNLDTNRIDIEWERNIEDLEPAVERAICLMNDKMADNIAEFNLDLGDLVGIRGKYICHEGKGAIYIDKLTFLASHK